MSAFCETNQTPGLDSSKSTQILQEKSPRDVEKMFGLPEKSLESLKDRAAGFAGMVAAFCQRLKYRHLEKLIASFQARPLVCNTLKLYKLLKNLLLSQFRNCGSKIINYYSSQNIPAICLVLDSNICIGRPSSQNSSSWYHLRLPVSCNNSNLCKSPSDAKCKGTRAIAHSAVYPTTSVNIRLCEKHTGLRAR